MGGRTLKIAIVNQWFPPETGGGGVATYNVAFAKSLKRLGHDVVVVTSTRQAEMRREQFDSIPVVRVPRPRLSRRLDRLAGIGKQMRALRTLLYADRLSRLLPELCREFQIDVCEYADIEAEAYRHLGRVPVPFVVRLHGGLALLEPYYSGREQPFATNRIKKMEHAAISAAAAWTAPSQHTAQLAAATYGLDCAKIQVIPNFLLHECAPTVLSRTCSVLFVGRLEWRKGADTFARAIPLVLVQHPDALFTYHAWDRPRPDGSSMQAYLTAQLVQAGALEHVIFDTGQSSSECLYRRLAPEICVVPSRFETFSYPCLEAMVHGLPIVASNASAIPEVVQNQENGLLFNPDKPELLAEGLSQLLENPARGREMGSRGRLLAQEKYDPLKLTAQFLAVYDRVVRRAGL